MGVKVPVEVLSINTYRLIYEIMNALDDYVICPDSQDKYDEQLMERIMSHVHRYIGKEQVKADISNCVGLMSCSDIDQYDCDTDGWFSTDVLQGEALEDLNPVRAMLSILWCYVPKPMQSAKSCIKPLIMQWFNYIGSSHEEFMCKAIEFRREYEAVADESLRKNWGDSWITKIVDLYSAYWKEIYNDE